MMMEMRIQHPKHGFHVVYTQNQLDAHKLLGWKVIEPKRDTIKLPKKAK